MGYLSNKARKSKPEPSRPAVAPAAKPQPTGAPRRGVQVSRPTKEEQEQVMRMQQIMAELGKAIDQNPGVLSSKTDIKDEARVSGAIRNTGTGTSTPFDGVWGPKTIAALNEINKSGVVKVQPGKGYKATKPGNVIALAKKNVDAIAELMRKVGFGSFVPSGVGARPEYYDKVPETLGPGNVRDYKSDDVAIRPSELDTIWNFHDMVVNDLLADLSAIAAYQDPNRIEKLASKIKDSSIVRLAQLTPQHQARMSGQALYEGRTAVPPQKVELEEESYVQGGDGKAITVGMMDEVLRWFSKRSKDLYKLKQDQYTSGEFYMDGDRKIPLATKEDADSARSYNDAVKRLVRNWNAQRDKFLQEDKDPLTAKVDRSKLRMWPEGKVPMARTSIYDSVREKKTEKVEKDIPEAIPADKVVSTKPDIIPADMRGDTFEGFSSSDYSILEKYGRGPIDFYMDLVDVYELIGESDTKAKQARDWIDQNFARTDISRSEINRMNPDVFAQNYRGNPSKSKRSIALNGSYAIREILKSVFATWKNAVYKAARELPSNERDRWIEAVRDQSRKLNAWSSMLTRKENDADRWRAGAEMKPRGLNRDYKNL